MKKSIYNVEKTIGESTWVFNTLSGSFIKLDTNIWTKIETSGIHSIQERLITLGFIVEDDYDETLSYKLRYYRATFDDKNLFIDIAPTMKCNFACHYCFEDGNKNFPVMNDETEHNIIKYLEVNKNKHIVINWFGGEPLMGFERIVSISKKLEEKSIDFRASIITNGSLLTSEKSKLLDSLHLDKIQITLDGVGDVHDNRRSFISGKPSFSIIINNIENFLSNCSVPLIIQVTVDKTNQSAYEDVYAYFNQKFGGHVESHRIKIGKNHVQNRTGFDTHSICFSAEDLIDDLLERIMKGHSDIALPNLSLPCMFRRISSFSIDSQGNIYHCLEHLGNPSCKIGNVNEGKISLSKLASNIMGDDPFADKDCLSCRILPICGGGCPIDRLKRVKDNTMDYCSIYKDKLENLLPLFYKYITSVH